MNHDTLSIIGIIASPDKLDSLKQFFDHMPQDSGLAFVIASAGETAHTSFPMDQLAQHTLMNINVAQDQMNIVPNSIYLQPPNTEMTIQYNRICIADLGFEQATAASADRFICSLAECLGDKAVVILFSGGVFDIAVSVDTIKPLNGIVMRESKKSYKPRRVSGTHIDGNRNDYHLSAQEMPQFLMDCLAFYANHSDESLDQDKTTLFSILKQQTGVDFSLYKQASILRRIQRRMGLLGFQYLNEYNDFLCSNTEEIIALQKDLLIGVTHFFRDPEAFSIIAEKVLPKIFKQHSEDKQIRVWIAGCSTGEEVYSLAILFRQFMQEMKEEFNVKIFATDLDKESIQYASRGIYPKAISNNLNPEQLNQFFTPLGGEYQVNKEIRQMVIFAQHNILKDPPFIQLDLITCRNMLIYLQPEMQRKVISLFHFALKSDAVLFLGPSETLGKLTNLFKSIDNKWNIYQYKEMNHWFSTSTFGISDNLNDKKLIHKNKIIARLQETERILKLDNIYTKLIEDYVPACIIIDENNDIVHINGNANQYLIIPKGKPSHSIFKMVPEYLSVAIGTALHKVRNDLKEVIYRDIIIKDSGKVHSINLISKPFHVHSSNDKLTIIFFEEAEENHSRINKLSQANPDQDYYNMENNINQRIKDLEFELYHAKESLQATIEELETSNEEFQASNEELIVANEELQSSNEELQSVNEELLAVNNEYQFKIQELTELNDDMSNFFNSTDNATIFLDKKMNIRKFSPAITQEFNLKEMDIGRSIGDISHNLIYDQLLDDARTVLLTSTAIEREVTNKDGKWFIVKILPYFTMENFKQGIVITYINISELKQANEELLVLSYAIQQSPGSIIITDKNRKIKYINTKYTEQTGYSIEDLVDTTLELYSDSLSSKQLREIWLQAGSGKKWVGELMNRHKDGEITYELATLLPIKNLHGDIIHFLKTSEDITEQKNTIELLHKSEMLSVVGQLAAGIAHEIRNPLTALKGFTKLLEPSTEKKNYLQIMSSELDRIESIISELLILARPQKLNFENKDILFILQDVIMLLESQAILNNVEIVTKFASSLPLISCVENQLKQVFINILKNGIEAMPHGGNLIVKAKMFDDSSIVVSFTDHGVGIPENKIPKLGDPFYTTKENGTGLGLMVSYKIIENHHGIMTINSSLGKGTTVDIVLRQGRSSEAKK